MNTKPIKKKIIWVLIGVAIIVVIGACVGVTMVNRPKKLFNMDSSEVSTIIIKNGDKLTEVTITDQSQIEEIVKLVNGFTYTSLEELPPSTGWSYIIILEDGTSFEFWESGVRVRNEDGSSILYYGKTGYFDSLVTLADNATDPM